LYRRSGWDGDCGGGGGGYGLSGLSTAALEVGKRLGGFVEVKQTKVLLDGSGGSDLGQLPGFIEHLVVKVDDVVGVSPADKLAEVDTSVGLVGYGITLVVTSSGPADLTDPYGLSLSKVLLDVVVSTLCGGQSSVNIDAHPKWKVVVHVDVLDRADVTPSWVAGTDSIDVSDGCGVSFRSQVLL